METQSSNDEEGEYLNKESLFIAIEEKNKDRCRRLEGKSNDERIAFHAKVNQNPRSPTLDVKIT